MHWAAKNGYVRTVEVLKAAGASSTIEALKGWTPDSVAIFHHNELSSISDATADHEDAKFELAIERSNNPSTAAVESIGDERKVSPGIERAYLCMGCLLVSFDYSIFKNSFF